MTRESRRSNTDPYRRPSNRRSGFQLLDSAGAYLGLWIAIGFSISVSWWLAAPLAALAGLFLVRVFIIFHDCCHGSFVASRRGNNAIGFLTGLLVFTPYDHWKGGHAIHHGVTGNLDRRGRGDIWTLTADEYQALPPLKRLGYRLARNSVILLGVAPLAFFVLENRFSIKTANQREKRSVWITNVGVLAWAVSMSLVLGVVPYLIAQSIILLVAGSVGVWLFFTQHQFEGAYWERTENWDFEEAALAGSAFLDLPPVLRFFTGSIGYHHVHHLDSKIPNYRLRECHEAMAPFDEVKRLSLASSMKVFGLKVWDEDAGKLIHFREIQSAPRARTSRATVTAESA